METSAELTSDEFSVLLITVRGESLCPIGRWKEPCLSLVRRGFLKRTPCPQDPTGEMNLVITPAGRSACEQRDDDDMRAIIGAHNKIVKKTLAQAFGCLHCNEQVAVGWHYCPACGESLSA